MRAGSSGNWPADFASQLAVAASELSKAEHDLVDLRRTILLPRDQSENGSPKRRSFLRAGCPRFAARFAVLFFVDPPYYGLTGYGVKIGVEHYEQLAEAMAHAKGKVILTVNDHPRMRQVCGRFAMESVAINYTVGGNKNLKPAKELVVLGGRRP